MCLLNLARRRSYIMFIKPGQTLKMDIYLLEKNASVKRGSHQVNDSDSAMVQVVMNKPPTRPPGQPRDSRAVSKDLGVRQQSLFDDQRQSVFVSRE